MPEAGLCAHRAMSSLLQGCSLKGGPHQDIHFTIKAADGLLLCILTCSCASCLSNACT